MIYDFFLEYFPSFIISSIFTGSKEFSSNQILITSSIGKIRSVNPSVWALNLMWKVLISFITSFLITFKIALPAGIEEKDALYLSVSPISKGISDACRVVMDRWEKNMSTNFLIV